MFVLDRVQNIMRYHHVKGNLGTSGDNAADLEDKFDLLMDANDQILERVVRTLIREKNAVFTLFCQVTFIGRKGQNIL